MYLYLLLQTSFEHIFINCFLLILVYKEYLVNNSSTLINKLFNRCWTIDLIARNKLMAINFFNKSYFTCYLTSIYPWLMKLEKI